MTTNEQALLAQMQDLGYSQGLCITNSHQKRNSSRRLQGYAT